MTTSTIRRAGFSLIELMVALALAGLVLLGLSAYFVTSSRSFSETERVSRQIENGRYASALLSEEIRHAGFYGEVGNVINLPPTSAIALPGALPNPCATDINAVKGALPLAIQGVDAPDTVPSCLPDHLAGTDVIVVRRAHTTTVSAAAADAIGNGYYAQVSYCDSADPMFVVKQSGFPLTGKDCATVRPVRQIHVYIYYIATCSVGTGSGGACAVGDPAIPTLKRAELRAGANWVVVPLVEGIEDMQIEYGRDTTGDGNPDSYTALPASVAEWAQVMAVRINLLARNVEPTVGYTDSKTYNLGNDRNGAAINSTPGGSYRRHAYNELVRVQNVSQRSEALFP